MNSFFIIVGVYNFQCKLALIFLGTSIVLTPNGGF
jgi:hypothetical protein